MLKLHLQLLMYYQVLQKNLVYLLVQVDLKFQETSNELENNITNLSEHVGQLKSDLVELENTLKTSNLSEEVQIKLNKQTKLMKLLLISKFI